MKSTRPNVGIGIFIFEYTKEKILIGKRKVENLFGLPGGALERGETFQTCACREIAEETGVIVKDESRIKFNKVFNSLVPEINYHWVNIYMLLDLNSTEEQEVKNLEEDKCETWLWVSFEDLMDLDRDNKLFYPLSQYLREGKINSYAEIRSLN
jgi:8-oxo-dGTP diphosphatase